MSVLELLQNIIGEEITPEQAESFADNSIGKMDELMTQVIPFYYDWIQLSAE